MKNLIYLCLAVTVWSCQAPEKRGIKQSETDQLKDENPPSVGFNIEASDKKAIDLADKVMTAMGGRKAWDETRFLSWNFFGSRKLLWDKWTGDVRVDFLKSDLKILVNIHDLKGKVQKDGLEMTQPDSIDFYLKRGKSVWINDSYWLVMPFKLKDSGVTLTYIGKDTTEVGAISEVLNLAFNNVGDTPENLYKVWVDEQTNLVTQWAFYADSEKEEPNFITPWDGYNKYGNIMLSGGRGRGQLTEIEVLESVSEDIFTNF